MCLIIIIIIIDSWQIEISSEQYASEHKYRVGILKNFYCAYDIFS